MHIQNIIALIITFAAALIFLRIMDFTAQKGWVGSRTSRKLIHIGTGPIFVICWLLFNDAGYTRWLAALVPLSITIQFALVGLGIMKDEGAVQGMSRTGDPREILRRTALLRDRLRPADPVLLERQPNRDRCVDDALRRRRLGRNPGSQLR